MRITKGLIIDEPWISKFLNGEKVWEMRSTQTYHRGHFALIRKGSGQVVGTANLTGVTGPYDDSGLARTFDRHLVPDSLYLKPEYKWRYAWHLNEVKALPKPIPYKHKSGAVTWVELDQLAIEGISKELSSNLKSCIDTSSAVEAEIDRLFNRPFDPEDGQTSYKPTSVNVDNRNDDGYFDENQVQTELRIELTQGNINNSHFYIPRQTVLFHESVWGGKNKNVAGTEVEFEFQGLDCLVFSDIDGSKRILRNRSALKEFYRLHKVCAGDEIKIQKATDSRYKVLLGNRMSRKA